MNSDFYLDRTSELTLLANWIEGKNRDDLALFEQTLFMFPNLYRAAVDGSKTAVQLYTEKKTDGVTITELMTAAHGNFPTADYLESKAMALLVQRNKLAENIKQPGADVAVITAKLLQIQAAIDKREVKPAAANLSDNFIKQLEEKASAKTMRYGRGFENLTKRAGAIRRGQLIVLAARPATGKSAAALQIGYNVAEKGNKVLFFPLEMTTQETLERLILQQQIVDSQTSLNAPTAEELNSIKSFLDDVEASDKFNIYEGVNQLETITQTIKEQRPDLVIIDQLTQVRTSHRTKDIRERYIQVTADLKAAAIQYQTAILLLTQLNRAATDKSAPTLENLHESDATGQNADVVLLMTKEEADSRTPDFARSDKITIHVVKNRGGRDGFRIGEVFNGERYTFSGISY